MKKRIALLIIDAQNDFCSPKGSLFVEGAVEDNERLSKWIIENKEEIDFIGCTLDSHQLIDIAHPRFWFDKKGNNPSPFTVISVSDVENGIWNSIRPKEAIEYLKRLDDDGKFPHVIWPEHCITGTWGSQLDSKINEAILSWASQGKFVKYVTKGENPFTEHFGAFEAEVQIKNAPSTQYNLGLIMALDKYDVIYLSGQAKSHCVANTLKQLVGRTPELAKKVIVLEDTMSPVVGGPNGPETTPTFEEISQPIYDEAAKIGVKFSTTVEEKLVYKSSKNKSV